MSKYCSLIQQTFGILKKRFHVLHYGLQTSTDEACTGLWQSVLYPSYFWNAACEILQDAWISAELPVLTGNNALAAHINMSDDAVGWTVRDHIIDTHFLWNVHNLISVRYHVLSKLFLHDVQDIICIYRYIFSSSFHFLISNFSLPFYVLIGNLHMSGTSFTRSVDTQPYINCSIFPLIMLMQFTFATFLQE